MQQATPPEPEGRPSAPAPAPGPSGPAAQPKGSPAGQPVAARVSNAVRLVIAAVVVAAAILTVFCAQNTGAASVRFLVWSWPGAPIFAVILAAVGLGIAIGGLFVWLRLARYSAQHRIIGRHKPKR